ncbi:transposase [Pseudoduganella sp. OTU4001]|uniref:transposase n=1 Tax=Pseudoduganella sp. OTU4001 TaxID=3043854 RepID=UPI00313C7A92
MPRRSRLVIPGSPFHIIQRGHNKHACFFEENDYHCYLFWLERLAREAGCDVHAYVLMTNHVHLVVTPLGLDSLALLMKLLNQHYVAYINHLHNRTGTLWEGRFRSCLVHDISYFLTCMRYVELNPVRAGMVAHPRDYCWSSYRANAEGAADSRIVRHPIYLALGETPTDRAIAYQQLFAEGIDEKTITQLRLATNSNYVVASEEVLADLSSRLGRQIHPGQPGRPHKPAK